MTDHNDLLIIQGGRPLSGHLRIFSAKNSALYLMLASLLTDEPVVLEDVPRLSDVLVTEEILRHVGVETHWEGRDLHLQARTITTCHAPYRLVSKMRASFVAMGALVGRCGEARIPMPGGCAFGPRPVDRHIQAFRDLGITVDEIDGDFVARRDGPLGGHVSFEVSTVGGTQNVLLAAALSGRDVVIENAALEPEVPDLARMLTAMGATVEGAGTSVIHVRGAERLHGVRYRPIPDRIEAGTYLLAAAASRGRVRLDNVRPDHLKATLEALSRTGVQLTTGASHVDLDATAPLRPTDIVARPFPGLPTDLQAPFGAFLATVEGTSTVRDEIYPYRFTHVEALARAGARMELEDRALRIEGGPLVGATMHAADIRAGGALVVAALAARGRSEISGVGFVDRGYEDVAGRLAMLGADVTRTRSDAEGRQLPELVVTGTYGR
ncbi:MAG: UDP-N-acetylglucosamine 1-carboxyvinyltransferase [Deinococcales bacterium]